MALPTWLVIVVAAVILISCGKDNSIRTHESKEPVVFRGVNFSIPVSDSDVQALGSEWHANVVRYQMFPDWPYPTDPAPMDTYYAWLQSEMGDVEEAMESCNRCGVKVIVDLHWSPGGTTENYETRLFYDQALNDTFISVWQQLALRFKDNPALLGYDLINEPHQNSEPVLGLDYLSTQARAIAAIRAIDSQSLIFVTPVEGENPDGFFAMRPFTDPRVLYEVHMYIPHAFTHQGVSAGFPDTVTYPGTIDSVYYDKEQLKEILAPVRAFQQQYNVDIFVGEFSAIRWAPGAAAYLSDCISIFEEYGWHWAYHDYASWEGFNLIYDSGTWWSDPVVNLENERLQAVLEGLANNTAATQP